MSLNFYELTTANKRRTWLLMGAFIVVALAVGYGFGLLYGAGPFGLVAALAISVVMSVMSYRSGDKLVLAISRARAADPAQEPRLHNLVEGLAIAAGIPKPQVYIVNDSAPNAFATGRDPAHASIAVTTGLLEKMNRVELEGVIAHELSHVKNRDTLVMVIAATLVGVVALLADWTLRSLFWGRGGRGRDREGAAVFALFGVVFAVLMPFVAAAMQAAISRRREGLADVSAIAMTRYPPGLVSALKKLRDDQTVVRSASRATAALWIESPLQRTTGLAGWWNRLFDTHPPLDERIKILEEM